jgi:C4-dicarboxylate transporter, DctQ subunit
MAIGVLIVVIINFANIVTRDLGLPIQLGQSQEVMVLIFVWITFLGIPLATKKRAHLGLSLLTDALPRRGQRIVAYIALSVTLFFLGALCYYGIGMVMQEMASKQTTPSLGLPNWPFGAAAPVSAILAIIRTLEVAYDDLWSGKQEVTK